MYLVCNLKANKEKNELISYEKKLQSIEENPKIKIIICPSTPFLYIFQGKNYYLGCQDISPYNEGAHTGENIASQLASLNVKYALIGHSERKQILKENEKTLVEKIKRAYHSHIHIIYFIGETKIEKETKQTEIILEKQITHIINNVPDYKRENMIIVYEPIWSIGTNIIPTNTEITSTINFIKRTIKQYYSIDLPVLYGGSVNERNIEQLLLVDILDGFVLGESSQNINELYKIYEKIKKVI